MGQTAVDTRQALGEVLYALASAAIRRRPRDISLTSASAMATLSRVGPMRLTDLATAEGIAQPSMTSLVTGLERNGYVERRTDPADRRVVLVALTEAGLARLTARRATGATWFTDLIDQLSEEDRTALAAALPALTHLRDLEPAALTSKEFQP
ncbi:MAG TPA: MarR family transcriptional regulator [Pseudonocardiaceae bacterium]|nr:MarR family transcriptional regulator [Pseudonocardiaceae bacterium]